MGLFDGKVAGAIGDTVSNVAETVGGIIETAIETAGDVAVTTVETVGEVQQTNVQTVGDLLNPITEGAGKLVQDPEAVGAIAGAVTGTGGLDSVLDGLASLADRVGSGSGGEEVIIEETDNTGMYFLGGAFVLGVGAVVASMNGRR